MRVSGNPESRFVGFVQVRVASRVFAIPVEAAPLGRTADPGRKAGLFLGEGNLGGDGIGILVDSDAPDKVQEETIERASADAARHLSRKHLN
jgi:hypothetical protein